MDHLGLVKNSFGIAHVMVGQVCLIGPIYTLNAGYISVFLAILFMVILSSTTSWLLLKHQGNCTNISQVNRCHFQKSAPLNFIFYLAVIILYIGLGFTFFQFGVMQLQGLFQLNDAVLNLIFFILWLGLTLLVRIFQIAESYISLGFISIIAFFIFDIWAIASSPQGKKTLPAFGSIDIPGFCSYLMFAVACQQVLYAYFNNLNTPRSQYSSVLKLAYFMTFIALLFFCYGAFGIINRNPRVEHPETIDQFFPYNNWEVRIIQIIFLAHLLTAGPFFNTNLIYYCRLIANIPEKAGYLAFDIILFIGFSILSLLVSIIHINTSTMLELSGIIGGFFYVVLIPVSIHIKCKYFGGVASSKNNQLEIENQGQEIQKHSEKKQKQFYCNNSTCYEISMKQIGQLCWLGFIVSFSGYLVVNRIVTHLFSSQ